MSRSQISVERGTRSILIVDDDREFLTLLATTLKEQGWTVYEALRAKEGMELADRYVPTIMLIDGLLPDGNGLDLLAWVRDHHQEIQTGFMSAIFTDLATYRTAKEDLGSALVLKKPLNLAELLVQLDALVVPTPSSSHHELHDIAEPEDDRIAALRHSFAPRLRVRLEALAAKVRDLKVDDDVALEELFRDAHKLHGTAGTYGFDSISRLTGQIETSVEFLRDSIGRARDFLHEDWPERRARFLSELSNAGIELGVSIATPSNDGKSIVDGSSTVLAVIPDAADRSRIATLAKDHLIRIVAVGNGDEALRVVRSAPVDGVIVAPTDESGTDGIGLIGALRGASGMHSLPIACLCDNLKVEDKMAGLAAGASMILRQPLRSDALGRAVESFQRANETPAYRVLLIEDDVDFAAEMATRLKRRGIAIEVICEPGEVLQALETVRPDLILCDLVMPGLSGFEICRLVRASLEWRELPFVFLTAKVDKDVRLAAYRAGADDYITKPIVEEELAVRLGVRMERARLLSERGTRDSLTGLLLRSAMSDRLATRIAELSRHQQPMTLVVLDLDHFKAVNDEHGHVTGDRVLSTLGRLIDMRLRREDLASRWGGEEFALAFFGEQAAAAAAPIQRILDEFATLEFGSKAGGTFRTSFSAGVAVFPDDGDSLTALFDAADKRMYAAKQAGRGRVVASG